jgi:hypothetical protein
MFFFLFFAGDMTELFLSAHKKPPAPVPPACPACGTRYGPGEPKCPSCGLISYPSEKEILSHRHLLSLPPERRAGYEKEKARIYAARGDFKERMKRLSALHRKFGFPE